MVKGGVVTLVPSTGIKCIEVIFPVEFKSIGSVVICIGLNIVEDTIPWHIHWVESMTPCIESRSPEVHHKRLALIHVPYSWVFAMDPSNFVTINAPGNEVWVPDHFIDMPVVKWIKVVSIVMGLILFLSVSIDCVH